MRSSDGSLQKRSTNRVSKLRSEAGSRPPMTSTRPSDRTCRSCSASSSGCLSAPTRHVPLAHHCFHSGGAEHALGRGCVWPARDRLPARCGRSRSWASERPGQSSLGCLSSCSSSSLGSRWTTTFSSSAEFVKRTNVGSVPGDAIAHGIKSTAGVVTAAATVMVFVFAIFATLSQLSLKAARRRPRRSGAA